MRWRWLVAVALLFVGCGDDDSAAPDDTVPADLVTGDPADWTVTVDELGTVHEASADAVAAAVPLHVARRFGPEESMASYGFDDPQAVLTFANGDDAVRVILGDQTFDDFGYYALVEGDEDSILVLLADQIDPLLAE